MAQSFESSIDDLILRIDSALAEDDAETSALRKELSIKSELADLTLTQLHQAQQQLQYYHQLCEEQAEMLEKSLSLLMKAVAWRLTLVFYVYIEATKKPVFNRLFDLYFKSFNQADPTPV